MSRREIWFRGFGLGYFWPVHWKGFAIQAIACLPAFALMIAMTLQLLPFSVLLGLPAVAFAIVFQVVMAVDHLEKIKK